jgi:hypothetical protein
MTPFPLRALTYLGGDDPLAGDLMEEYARGRSSIWLWRQVAAAVAMAPLSAVRRHPIDAFRAVVVLALFLPFVLNFFYLLPRVDWRPSGPVLVERVPSLPSWIPWFGALVFYGWFARTLAGRFKRAVLISFGAGGIGIILHSGWSMAAVLWLYPWNGAAVFARWAAIYGCLLSLFTLALWLGGRLRFSAGHTPASKHPL